MTLRRQIVLWVFVASTVPMLGLAVFATYYSQEVYKRTAHEQILSSLGRLVSEIGRRLLLEREVVLGLSRAPALRDFVPVLAQASRGALHPAYLERADRLNRFLRTFEEVMPSLRSARILDLNGNTLIKVEEGRAASAAFEGLEDLPYVDYAMEGAWPVPGLDGLRRGEVGSVLLPRYGDRADTRHPPLLDAVIPLFHDGEPAGYFSARLRSAPIDRILAVMPRLYSGRLLVAEVNPDDPGRDGLLLFDDETGVGLSTGGHTPGTLRQTLPRLYAAVLEASDGWLEDPAAARRIYYMEYMPYPDRLISWVIATRVPTSALVRPYRQIHAAIVVTPLVVLAFSLLLAHLGGRRIGSPMGRLTEGLEAYAQGRRQVSLRPEGPREMRDAVRAFNDMGGALEHAEHERDEAQGAMLRGAKLASIGEMAAGIGHEINNPLNNILSLTRLIERAPAADRETLMGDVWSIRDEARRASRIVSGILNFARQVPPDYARFRLAAWLEEALTLISRLAGEQGVAIGLDVATDLDLDGDPHQLQQTLVNVLANAVQASSHGGAVRVSARAAGPNVEIRVEDDGPGVAPEHLERVFDPFFTTKPTGEGSGLGLSISLGIVEQHGGGLRLGNREGGGAVVTIVLPRHRPGVPNGVRGARL